MARRILVPFPTYFRRYVSRASVRYFVRLRLILFTVDRIHAKSRAFEPAKIAIEDRGARGSRSLARGGKSFRRDIRVA